MSQILDLISENFNFIFLLILMIILGFEVISRVPAVLHTPLMSGANAIHGVVIIGAIIVMGQAESDLGRHCDKKRLVHHFQEFRLSPST